MNYFLKKKSTGNAPQENNWLFFGPFSTGATLAHIWLKITNSETTLNLYFLQRICLQSVNLNRNLLNSKKGPPKIHLLWHLLSVFWGTFLVSFATIYLQRHILYTDIGLATNTRLLLSLGAEGGSQQTGAGYLVHLAGTQNHGTCTL